MNSFQLSVKAFDTHQSDILSIESINYSGDIGPSGVIVTPSTQISWSSDVYGFYKYTGFEVCAVCAAGTYGSPGECVVCSAGFYSPSDSSACAAACPTGTYVHAAQCLYCPAGQFSSAKAFDSCFDCPFGMFSNSGSSSCKIEVSTEEALKSNLLSYTTIVLTADIYLSSTLRIDGRIEHRNIAIDGQGIYKVDGQQKWPCIFISFADSVTLTGLTITNGYSSDDGSAGGVDISSGSVTMTSCTISNNSAVFVSDAVLRYDLIDLV